MIVSVFYVPVTPADAQTIRENLRPRPEIAEVSVVNVGILTFPDLTTIHLRPRV